VNINVSANVSLCRIHQKHTRPNKRNNGENVTIDRLGHLGYVWCMVCGVVWQGACVWGGVAGRY